MWWLLLAFGIIGVCGTASSPIIAAVLEVVRCDIVGLWYRCCGAGGEVRGMKSLCTGSELKCGVW